MSPVWFYVIMAFWAFFALKADVEERQGKIPSFSYKVHLGLCLLILLGQYPVLNNLLWIMYETGGVWSELYVSVGPIPAWLNALLWILSRFKEVALIGFAVALMDRSNTARVLFVLLLPFFGLLDLASGCIGYYRAAGGDVFSLGDVMPIILLGSIPYAFVFVFYAFPQLSGPVFADDPATLRS